MKSMILVTMLMLNFSVFARDQYFEGSDFSAFCKGAFVLDDGYKLECRGAANFAEVKKAYIEKKNLKNPPQALLNNIKDVVFEYRLLPDDSTDLMYMYVNKMISKQGKTVGYAVIRGMVNTEMEVRLQVLDRYDLKGELIEASVNILD